MGKDSPAESSQERTWERTRERILRSGSDLLSRSGFSGVSLSVLAEEARMSKSGLFGHFDSKEDVEMALLERTAALEQRVLGPAMKAKKGLPRLRALIESWLGWPAKAGLAGGCARAAGMFEFDDREGPVRQRLLAMEKSWRDLLAENARAAIHARHLRSDLDVGQFVWDVCGIYLSHHMAARFLRDPDADARGQIALEALFAKLMPGD